MRPDGTRTRLALPAGSLARRAVELPAGVLGVADGGTRRTVWFQLAVEASHGAR